MCIRERVRKWDTDARMDSLREEIQVLKEELTHLQEESGNGENVEMSEFWSNFVDSYDATHAAEWIDDSSPESLYSFMYRLILQVGQYEQETGETLPFSRMLPRVQVER